MEGIQLGIIDYGAGNLKSVYNSFLNIGVSARLVKLSQDVKGLTHLVLPGVGSFGDCAENLRKQQLDTAIRAWIAEDRPFLGICVGYQVLFDESEETPGIAGLSVFKGIVRRFPSNSLKVPHMGWNDLTLIDDSDPVWKGMGFSPYFYFVHSYFPVPEDKELISSTCEYGARFASSIRRGRLIATQFHPEKSQKTGELLLRNFLDFETPVPK